jgi:HPr kinase/phosphorylase
VSEDYRGLGPGIPVGDLLGEEAAHLRLRLRAGAAGLDKRITFPRIQKAALAAAGHIEAIHPGRVQILGSSEMTYLGKRAARWRAAVFRKVCSRAPVACFVITRGLDPPEELIREAEAHAIAVFTTDLMSSACIDQIQRYLDDRLAPRTTVHGDLVDVYGLGVLLLGQSGIGKSECALDLITRGHRLVSDDVVEIRRESSILVGSGPELTKYHMEIRGLGVINIRDLFGISAIRNTKFIELTVMLEPWQEGKPYDRLGLDEPRYTILDVELPLVRMPVAPGRNLAILIEVASRNQLLKLRGYHGARSFVDRMTKEMERRSTEDLGRMEAGVAPPEAPAAEGERLQPGGEPAAVLDDEEPPRL